MPKVHGSRSSLLKKLTVVGGLTLALLGLAELALRFAEPAEAALPSLEERVAAVGEKEPSRARVLVLGDGLTEHQEHERKSWARVLEQQARAAGHELELHNFAEAGTGLPQYLETLEAFGARVRPDLVVIALSLDDDVLDYELELERSAHGVTAPSSQRAPLQQEGLVAALQRGSALLALVSRGATGGERGLDLHVARLAETYGLTDDEVKSRLQQADAEMLERARAGGIDAAELALGLLKPSRYAELLSVRSDTQVSPALERLESDVERLEERCAKLQARCAWLLLPAALQVHERHHAHFRRLGYETAGWMTSPTPLWSRLRTSLMARGLTVIDPLPALQESSAERDVFLPMDRRLNHEGRRVVGELAYEQLDARGALGGSKGPAPEESADPRLRALLQGSVLDDASAEERRLAEKIGGHRDLREELQAVLKSLPEERAAAEALQARIREAEKGLDRERVKEALAKADEALRQQGAGEGTLLRQARGIDERLPPLMARESAHPDDTPTVRRLKVELKKQQQATAALGTGASVAFRALRLIEQMKLALPELEER